MIAPKEVFIDHVKLLLLVAAIYFLYSLLGSGCWIKSTTGLSCPGCGMTRAVLSAMKLNFTEAFYYHPLFFITPFMALLYLFEAYLKPSYVKATWFIILSSFLIVYLIRLFITQNDVVELTAIVSDNLIIRSEYP